MLDDPDQDEDEDQERGEPDQTVPEKGKVVYRFAIKQLREQISAEHHEKRHAGVTFVKQSQRKHSRGALEGLGISTNGMREVPSENHEHRDCPNVVKPDEVQTG